MSTEAINSNRKTAKSFFNKVIKMDRDGKKTRLWSSPENDGRRNRDDKFSFWYLYVLKWWIIIFSLQNNHHGLYFFKIKLRETNLNLNEVIYPFKSDHVLQISFTQFHLKKYPFNLWSIFTFDLVHLTQVGWLLLVKILTSRSPHYPSTWSILLILDWKWNAM